MRHLLQNNKIIKIKIVKLEIEIKKVIVYTYSYFNYLLSL